MTPTYQEICELISRWLLGLPETERVGWLVASLTSREAIRIWEGHCSWRAIWEASPTGELWPVFSLDETRRWYLNDLVRAWQA